MAGPRRLTLRIAVATAASTVLIHLPIFLLGALAVLIQADLPGFDEARLGATTSVFFGTSAVASLLGGRQAQAAGPRRGMLVAALLSALSLGLAAAAGGLVVLMIATAVAGAANGIGQPASNLGIARGVRPGRQGLAFGIKQCSVPFAGLLAGLSIPLLGLVIGWRWTFALAAALALPIALLVPRRFASPAGTAAARGAAEPSRRVRGLVAAGAGFGSAAANSLGGFAVLSIVAAGYGSASAGYLAALGGVAGVTARLTAGWRADRRGRGHLRVVTAMLACGAVGFVLLGFGDAHPAVLVLGVLTAYGAGWGWPGLLAFAVVRLHPRNPAVATGLMQSGAMTGSVVGPLVFGLVAAGGSFRLAWLLAAGSTAIGAGLILLASRAVRRAIDDRTIPAPSTR